jgi:hypothetical protein
MAKKKSKLGAGKKTPKKAAAKAKPARRAAPRKSAATAKSPFPITTGKGAGAAEIGRSLVELYNQGKWDEPCKLWWSPQIVSVEGAGMAWTGRNAVDAKNADWYKTNTVIGGSAEGPFVGASGFAVKFRVETEEKATGKRTRLEEVGVYTVQDGKIVREEFMYGPMQVQHMPAATG